MTSEGEAVMRPPGEPTGPAGPEETERWRRVRALFEELADRDEGERAAILETLPEDVREPLARLLAADRASEPRLERTPDQLGADLALTGHPLPERIGSYRILGQLGRGGMGDVLLGRRADGVYEQDVAIKLVRRGMDSEDVLRRFRAERQILARLKHPNIATLLDGGMAPDGRPYFVLELVRGSPITTYCEEHALSLAERLQLFATACAAVQHAHEHGVVHRDLKPRNIIVADAATPAEGTVKLLDFGIARLLDPDALDLTAAHTHTGMRLMTPEYASPEQLRGEHVGPASDVYSLGAVLHELLTGRRPHDLAGQSPAEAVRLVTASTPTRLERAGRRLPAPLSAIVAMALRPEPERRYASAGALGEDVRRYVAGEPVRAKGDALTYRVGTFVRRRRAALALIAAAAGTAVGVAGALSGRAAFLAPPIASAAGPVTLAVLPFHYGGPEEEEYHSVGVADALGAHLAAVPRLTVVARGRTMPYRDPNRTPQELGAELGVDFVLDGTVRFERPTDPSGRVLAMPRLIRVADGDVVWGRRFDRTMVQFFPLQTAIARQVAEALGLETDGVPWTTRGAAATADLEAWRLYLRGNESLRFTADLYYLRLAEAAYSQALARDSTFARAWAKLSGVHIRMWFYYYDRSDARLERAGDAADRALRLGPELPEAHYALGTFLYHARGDLPGAQRQFERALELQPNHLSALRGLASALLRQGRTDEALSPFERLAVLDPLESSRMAIADAQPFFTTMECIDGINIAAACRPVAAWCASAGGVVEAGACWFLGRGGPAPRTDGASCHDVCREAELVYDGATRFFAGSDGTDANCIAVLTALRAPANRGFQTTIGRPLGCAVSRDANISGFPDWVRVTGPSATTAAARGNERRACACRPDF